jgi:hypothetical protein
MTNTILRREIKFLVNSLDTYLLKRWFFKKKILENYPRRKINSLYYDHLKFHDLKSNLTGLANREKSRLRWYNNDQQVYFEKKIKNNFLSKKHSVKLDIQRDKLNYLLFFSHTNSELNKFKILLNAKSFLLRPVILISYQRNYFKYGKFINVTLDTNINFRDYDTKMKYCNNNRTILEIKYDIKHENNVNKLIQDLPIAQTRSSKYLLGMASIGKVNYI